MDRKRAEAEPTPVDATQATVLGYANAKAALAPGLFTLMEPTDGGKTLLR